MSTTRRGLLVAIAALAAALGCKDDPGSREEVGKPPPRPTETPANVVKVETLVPYGQKVPCSKLIDAAKFGATLGYELTLVDKSAEETEPTAICGLKLGGKPLSEAEQKKIFNKNNYNVGVLPGDEIFQIRFYCSDAYLPNDTRKYCEKQGWEISTEIGDLTCVQKVQAGEFYRHVVHVLDPDTKCKYEVSPITLTDLEPVKKAAKAAVDLVGPENVKVN